MKCAERVLTALRPARYVLAISGFSVLRPTFMDPVTPDVITGYAGGTVGAQGHVVSRYEGGTARQYQGYYPVIWPFIAVWFVSVLFGRVDGPQPLDGPSDYLALGSYFYLLVLVHGALFRRAVRTGRSHWPAAVSPDDLP